MTTTRPLRGRPSNARTYAVALVTLAIGASAFFSETVADFLRDNFEQISFLVAGLATWFGRAAIAKAGEQRVNAKKLWGG